MSYRTQKGGRGYSKYLYGKAQRKWIIDLAYKNNRYIDLNQNEIISRLKLSWPAWRSIINGGDMKLSTFMRICDHFHIPLYHAIMYEQQFQQEKSIQDKV